MYIYNSSHCLFSSISLFGYATGSPSAQPSNQPTTRPSTLLCPPGHHRDFFGACTECEPGKFQETFVESLFVTECENCAVGSYQPNHGQDRCILCPLGSQCPQETLVDHSLCPPGFYQDQEGSSSCKLCPPGFISEDVGRPNICSHACEAGSFAPEGSTQCTLCGRNSYQSNQGSGYCFPCPAGLVSHSGSVDLNQCIDPAPNFAIAYMALTFIGALAIPYVYFDRFRRVAFFREQRVFKPLEALAGRVSAHMTLIVTFCSEIVEKEIVVATLPTVNRIIRVTIFIVVGTTIATIITFVGYSMYLFKKMFSVLLVWKGLGLDDALVSRLSLKLTVLVQTLQDLGAVPIAAVATLSQEIVVAIAGTRIDFERNVNCAGTQAPLEMSVNIVVLGLVILIINADIPSRLITLVEWPSHKVTMGLHKSRVSIEGRGQLIFACICSTLFVEMDPLIRLVQIAMINLSFGGMIEEGGLMPASTGNCNTIDPATPFIDSVIAVCTVILAVIILPPAVYTISKVIVEHGDGVPQRFRVTPMQSGSIVEGTDENEMDGDSPQKMSCRSTMFRIVNTGMRYFSCISPDVVIAHLILKWLKYLYFKLSAGHPDDPHPAQMLVIDKHGKTGKSGNTPLHKAAQYGHATVVAELINHGLDVNLRNDDGYTGLHLACMNGKLESARQLLCLGADRNVVGGVWASSPLHLACIEGNRDIIKLLVEKGANKSQPDGIGRLPFDYIKNKDLRVEMESGEFTVETEEASEEIEKTERRRLRDAAAKKHPDAEIDEKKHEKFINEGSRDDSLPDYLVLCDMVCMELTNKVCGCLGCGENATAKSVVWYHFSFFCYVFPILHHFTEVGFVH